MGRKSLMTVIAVLVLTPLAIYGCKGKVEKPQSPDTSMTMSDTMLPPDDSLSVTEPAQTMAVETIPPSAAPQAVSAPQHQTVVSQAQEDRSKDIQVALKNAGFYAGPIDGKIGPKSKKAIEDFQRSKGLKADGKVGPKTWGELEKYLIQQ